MEQRERKDLVYDRILQDMGEGVLTLGLDGTIDRINPAAEAILGISREEVRGQKFSRIFFRYGENDLFNQTILDAVYDTASRHESVVPYFDGQTTRQLRVMTTFLHEGEEKIGLVAVIGDLTDIVEMERRHVQEVNTLVESMVKTLSVAIDERSHYTARHTRHMVSMGEAFLDWLEETGQPWQFDAEQRRVLLMSIWLHDVGKIAIPLEIMDKASRLGAQIDGVERRFDRIALLERIAFLEGRQTAAEYREKTEEMARILDFVKRINTKGFVTDEELREVRRLGSLRYTEEDGRSVPLFTDNEIEDLSIRKGTLTAGERQVMQSHALITRKILEQVSFPPHYADVPLWASSHHELLNGQGYPERPTGEEIPREVQLITILDIFEALTAKDRPYKPPIPLEKAWDILDSMVREGSLNGKLLERFRESGAWRKILSEEGE